MGNGAITFRPFVRDDAYVIYPEGASYPPADSWWQVTMCVDDEPVAAGGIALQWPNKGPDGYVGLAWFLIRPGLPPRLRQRALLKLRSQWRTWQEDFVRVEMLCTAHDQGYRLAGLLGFTWRCVRRRYFLGEDVTMYDWVKPCLPHP